MDIQDALKTLIGMQDRAKDMGQEGDDQAREAYLLLEDIRIFGNDEEVIIAATELKKQGSFLFPS